jgi:hypothetical protein
VIRVVILVFVTETTEVLGPHRWIFPFRDKVDEPVAVREALFCKLCDRAANELGPRVVGKPSGEARALFAQIAKNRWLAFARRTALSLGMGIEVCPSTSSARRIALEAAAIEFIDEKAADQECGCESGSRKKVATHTADA